MVSSGAKILAGPRTGIKNRNFQIPENLSLEGLGYKVKRVDALPYELPVEVEWKGQKESYTSGENKETAQAYLKVNQKTAFLLSLAGTKEVICVDGQMRPC